jgi:hypothetical protein
MMTFALETSVGGIHMTRKIQADLIESVFLRRHGLYRRGLCRVRRCRTKHAKLCGAVLLLRHAGNNGTGDREAALHKGKVLGCRGICRVGSIGTCLL